MKALAGHHIVKVACGSRDAQTLALSSEGLVFSWGDGDFGKLGRGGSEGCDLPQNVEKLNGLGVIHIECGAQFSLALTKSGQVSISNIITITRYLPYGKIVYNICNSLCGKFHKSLITKQI